MPYHETSPTVALIAAGALLAPHVAPEAPEHQQMPRVAAAAEHNIGATGIQTVVEADPGVTEHTSINGNTETKVLDILDTRPFAPGMNASSEAHEPLNPQQMNSLTLAVKKDLTGQGYKVTGVNFQGSASGEAAYQKEDSSGAGEDVTDSENITLANDRAQSVAETVVPMLDNLTHENVPSAFKQGVEVNRPDLAAKEAKLAHELGKTPVELMRDWNRNPQSVSKEVRDTLSPLIGDRNVTTEVTGEHTVQKPTATHTASSAPKPNVPQPPFWVYPDAIEAPIATAPTTGPAAVSSGYEGQHGRLVPNNAQAAQKNLQLARSHKQPRQANFNGVNRTAPKPLRPRMSRSHGGNLGRPAN